MNQLATSLQMHLKMQVKNRPQAEHASRLIPGGSTRLAFVLGTPARSSGVVVAEPWCVPLVGRPLLRLASDILWDRCGAEPREAKMSKHDLHIHTTACLQSKDPKSRDPSGIKQSNW